MAIINPSDLTFNGEEVRQLSEAIYESVYSKPELKKFHDVVGGIKSSKQIVFLGRLNGLTGKGTGACNATSDTNTITNTEKYWNTATVSNQFEACWTELRDTFFIYGTKNGIDKKDLTKTDFFNFLIERVKDALLEEVFRIAWFSDVDAADVNASPAGVLTAGTNVAYFNKIDGLWNQIDAIVATTPARLTSDLNSRNSQSTFALQAFTSTDTTNFVVTNALQNVRYGADMRLREKQNLVYIVTQSVLDQYERELTKANQSFTTERLENGMSILKSGGIEVIGFQFWDRIIQTYYSNGTKYYRPHRIVLTTSDNLKIGTEEEGTFSNFKSVFDEVTDMNYLKTQYDIDAKVYEDYLIQVAY